MTLLAIWHRQKENDLYAMADSRLVNDLGNILSDNVPKFGTIRIRCLSNVGNADLFQDAVIDRTIGIGFAGSAVVAYSTIVTLQSCLSNLAIHRGKSLPDMKDVAIFTARILGDNFRQFGILWQNKAKCSFVLFGAVDAEVGLQAFSVVSKVEHGEIIIDVEHLELVGRNIVKCAGSGKAMFAKMNLEHFESGGGPNFFPVLRRLIDSKKLNSVGGHIQVAIANLDSTTIPFVMDKTVEEPAMEVAFLGRSIGQFGRVGNAMLGLEAEGPSAGDQLRCRARGPTILSALSRT